MRVGRLDTILTFEENQGVSDGMGGRSTNWRPVVKLWGRQIKNNPSFGNQLDQETGWNTATFETRFNPAVKIGQRVKFQNEYYQVKNVFDPTTQRKALHIICLKKSYEN